MADDNIAYMYHTNSNLYHTNTYVHTHMCIHICAYTYTCTHMWIYIYRFWLSSTAASTARRVTLSHVYIIQTHIRIHVHIHTYIYTYIHRFWRSSTAASTARRMTLSPRAEIRSDSLREVSSSYSFLRATMR